MDLDRTLIPNGPSVDDGSLPLLKASLDNHHIIPIFVTARHIDSIYHAIKRYSLPQPHAIIAQVGSRIYLPNNNGNFKEMQKWKHHITQHNPHWDPTPLSALHHIFPQLTLQDPLDCHTHKVSYNLCILQDIAQFKDILTRTVSKMTNGECEIIISQDLNSQKGYVDILPRGVTKKSALDFLSRTLAMSHKNLIFAGDSENDLSILLSQYQTVVVANALSSLKEVIAQTKSSHLHFEASPFGEFNGNYSSGILQGLAYFKWIEPLLK